MKFKVTGKITHATRGNNSYYGNPSYKNIVVVDEKGDVHFFDRTATNSSAGYACQESNRTAEITAHTTKTGTRIIDYIKWED